jgi:glycosyltransferase involved in cell wall biosynthesis
MRNESAPASAPPRVSVCLPVYNGANYITDAIRSVLRQTWTDLELVVQDNGSTDDTVALANSFDDERLSVRQNETNLGIARNINRSVERSRGEYVHLLCHDDVLAPTCLDEQVEFLDAHPSVGVVFTWAEAIDAAGESKGPMLLDRFIPQPEILSPSESAVFLYTKGCSPHISTAMFRRAALTRFDGSFKSCGDWAKWAEVSARGDIAIIRKVLVGVRFHDANLTHAVLGFNTEEVYRVLEMLEPRLPAGFPAARIRRQRYGQIQLGYAIRAALNGRVGQALNIVNVLRHYDPILPVAVAYLLSRPAAIKRKLSRFADSVRPARRARAGAETP